MTIETEQDQSNHRVTVQKMGKGDYHVVMPSIDMAATDVDKLTEVIERMHELRRLGFFTFSDGSITWVQDHLPADGRLPTQSHITINNFPFTIVAAGDSEEIPIPGFGMSGWFSTCQACVVESEDTHRTAELYHNMGFEPENIGSIVRNVDTPYRIRIFSSRPSQLEIIRDVLTEQDDISKTELYLVDRREGSFSIWLYAAKSELVWQITDILHGRPLSVEPWEG